MTATKDPDMAHWDALPFVGWHIPDHLRVIGGKAKSPLHGGRKDRSEVDKETYRRRKEKLAKEDKVDKIAMAQKKQRQVMLEVKGEIPRKNEPGSTKACTVYVTFPDGHEEVFPSISKASWAIGATPGSIRAQTAHGRPVKGCAVKIVRSNGSYTQAKREVIGTKPSGRAIPVVLKSGKEKIRCQSFLEAATRLGLHSGSVRRAFLLGREICGWKVELG